METEAEWLDVNDLRHGRTPREGPLDPNHIAALAELEGRWPPILVAHHDHRVIDGHHRLAAAHRLGYTKILATLFHGTTQDAYVESIRRNVEHGLPLTLHERKTAAQQLLHDHPDWSDRRIAQVCALSPRTIGRLRPTPDPTTNPNESRIGRDGRQRPIHHETTRHRILDAVQANPGASLRAIAQLAGTSPETVRRVRQTINQPTPTSAPTPHTTPGTAEILTLTTLTTAPTRLRATNDPALTSTPDGQQFATWFDHTDPGNQWPAHAAAMPLSRTYEIADDARRRAHTWTQFAELVEQRARTHRAG